MVGKAEPLPPLALLHIPLAVTMPAGPAGEPGSAASPARPAPSLLQGSLDQSLLLV